MSEVNSSEASAAATSAEQAVEQAVAGGGAYEVLRARLAEQAAALEAATVALNERRESEFGGTALELSARVRVRTENNCVPRDIVRVGRYLLFGYNVFIGLRKQTTVADVFSVYEMVQGADDSESLEIKLSEAPFLSDPAFERAFQELYEYYKQTTLVRMQVLNQRLLVSFRIGAALSDVRVFRWSLEADGGLVYIDDRGERDVEPPARYDFEWQDVTREQQVLGKHSHYSILDRVFVETIGGDLTIKLENNTEEGYGIYAEPVEESNQALDDADISYADLGTLLLLRITPYREEQARYFIYNARTEQVSRHDAIEQACVSLPEDQGVVFPGGYHLASGEEKTFGDQIEGLTFSRKIVSPNGEDVMYVFYEQADGNYALFPYNVIRRELGNPIIAHGYSLFEDGRLVIFRSETNDPTRNHPMQVWNTTFTSDDFLQQQPPSTSELGKIGNQSLVRGVADLYAIARSATSDSVSMTLFEDLIKDIGLAQDAHYWLEDSTFGSLAADLKLLRDTAELVVDEFSKVAEIQAHARRELTATETQVTALLRRNSAENRETTEAFVAALSELRSLRGHLVTIRELRYIDTARIDELEASLVEADEVTAQATVEFLLSDGALTPYQEANDQISASISEIATVAELQPVIERLEELSGGLDLLTEVLGSIEVEDATARTEIIESISRIYGELNRTRAEARLHSKELGAGESVAQFAAEIALFSQGITSAIDLADTPAACDEQRSRLSVSLEELESRFGEYEQFTADIITKREELFETFESRKQTLLDEQQRRALTLSDAGSRIVESVRRRTQRMQEADELNAYFSTDGMIHKLREMVVTLRELGDSVKADELEANLRAAQDDAVRALRDKRDMFEGDGQVVRLGSHRFSVNEQELDLSIVTRDDGLYAHLNGSGFMERIESTELEVLKPFWGQHLVSETDQVYRAEYLAGCLMLEVEASDSVIEDGALPTRQQLSVAVLEGNSLDALVREYALARYQEGYERGVHDSDAAAIIRAVWPRLEEIGRLRYTPDARALALLFWSHPDPQQSQQKDRWQQQAQSARQLVEAFQRVAAIAQISAQLAPAIDKFVATHNLPFSPELAVSAAAYLTEELGESKLLPWTTVEAVRLVEGLRKRLDRLSMSQQLDSTLLALEGKPAPQLQIAAEWLRGYVASEEASKTAELQRYIYEAAVLLITDEALERQSKSVDLAVMVEGLLGDHPRISERKLSFTIDAFLSALEHHRKTVAPGYLAYSKARANLADELRDELQLDGFKPRPLSSFVRNKLINDVYLPIIGANLAKQMGTVGEDKRTDLMGLLLLISPPGYGKTTLMEYVAHRLGLVFMKINAPALGHDVKSLDPAQAPDATAARELEKLNLGLEMGNNVMLYVDDIQHTNPEFLQKFISLCDGTRRIEGVWRGETKTYDLRGRKVCVVMAGNPYTESGELFRVPDMLANRADIYNLGDVLSGRDDVFALSYVENCITSNSVLAPLANRDMEDVYRFVRLAKGETVATTDFSHSYSAAEIEEIKRVLERLFAVQDTVLKVNMEYIRSAAMEDKYRTEPAFKLQGSYRNMNKLAEKIAPVMDEKELDALLSDHYVGEAQLLTTGAEANLLKLKSMRGSLSEAETQRWQEILSDFQRIKAMGGDGADAATRIASQLSAVTDNLDNIREALDGDGSVDQIATALASLRETVAGTQLDIQVVNQPSEVIESAMAQMARSIETTFMPVVAAMNKKIDLDLNILRKVEELSEGIEDVRAASRAQKGDT